MGKPNIPNVEAMIQAGINPRTGLPVKMDDCGCSCKASIRSQLDIVDRQDALNRYTWYNVPEGLSGNLIERILYYKGQGAFFYMDTVDKFFFLPYALSGSIDCYGRFNTISPVSFGGGTTDDGKAKPFIDGMTRDVAKEVIVPEDLRLEDLTTKCVLLRDYSNGISQTIVPRAILQTGLLDIMSECIPFLRTALSNATGVMGMRVSGQDDYSNVEAASRSINTAALEGRKYIPIVGNVDFQEMTGGQVAKSEEFLLTMQSLDNYRLSLYGLDNGGLFQKKSHILEEEEETNGGNVGLILQDGLEQRQSFCNIVNSIWGVGIWCQPSEVSVNADEDGNGLIEGGADDDEQSVR